MHSLPKHILEHPKLIPEYRPNVAALILRHDGAILWCERTKPPHLWQFPQGGVDKGETEKEALFRELKEELGLQNPQQTVQIIKRREKRARYTFPVRIIERYLNNDQPSYIGQEQTWFLLRFTGTDEDININFEGKNSEFRSFFWGGIEHLSRVQYYKRKTYRKLFVEFSIS